MFDIERNLLSPFHLHTVEREVTTWKCMYMYTGIFIHVLFSFHAYYYMMMGSDDDQKKKVKPSDNNNKKKKKK